MKIQNLLGGLFITGAVVSVGSAGLGAANKKLKEEKKEQSELITKIIKTGISDNDLSKVKTSAESKLIPYEINKAYKNTLDSLTLKAQYEKVYLQTIDSLKKVIKQKDDSIKILTKATK